MGSPCGLVDSFWVRSKSVDVGLNLLWLLVWRMRCSSPWKLGAIWISWPGGAGGGEVVVVVVSCGGSGAVGCGRRWSRSASARQVYRLQRERERERLRLERSFRIRP